MSRTADRPGCKGHQAVIGLISLLFICGVFCAPSVAQEPEDPMARAAREVPDGVGVPLGRVFGITEDWVKQFFANPEPHIEHYLGIASCTANPQCANMANDVLRRERPKWRASPKRGKILVCLAYVIGASTLREKADLSWKIDYG